MQLLDELNHIPLCERVMKAMLLFHTTPPNVYMYMYIYIFSSSLREAAKAIELLVSTSKQRLGLACCVMALKSKRRWWLAGRRIEQQTYIGESLRDCRLGVREPKANTCIRPHHHPRSPTLTRSTNTTRFLLRTELYQYQLALNYH